MSAEDSPEDTSADVTAGSLPDFDQTSLGDKQIPAPLVDLGATADNLEWHNELGGLTFNLGHQFLKWNPKGNGVDLRLEWDRLGWIAGRHPAPTRLEWAEDDNGQWMVTETVAGGAAVGDQWRARTREAIAAIAEGLRVMHSVPMVDFPDEWPKEIWVSRSSADVGKRPPIDGPVLVHGDACAPNTLINDAGQWTGNVDFGDLTVGDRWADLAIASMSLDWNFGPGHQDMFFDLYGCIRDDKRITYYRRLWHLES